MSPLAYAQWRYLPTSAARPSFCPMFHVCDGSARWDCLPPLRARGTRAPMAELSWLGDYAEQFLKSPSWCVPIAEFIDECARDCFRQQNSSETSSYHL